jgi:hypothetical protein
MPLSLGIASGAGFLKNPAEPAALGYRVNYITNPSFEVDTTNWTATASGTLARTTGEFNTGSASLAVTNGSGSGAQFGNEGSMIPLVAGEGTYYLSAYPISKSYVTTEFDTLTSILTLGEGYSAINTRDIPTNFDYQSSTLLSANKNFFQHELTAYVDKVFSGFAYGQSTAAAVTAAK